MDKLTMSTIDRSSKNIEVIKKYFPQCITEKIVIIDGKEIVKYSVDIEKLKIELEDISIDSTAERYQFTWPDKSKFIRLASESSNKTLRPKIESSVNFESTENIYIEGDNFEVLKLLRETYLNSIKLIYVDPPYNTGDDLIYKNSYEVDLDTFQKLNAEIDENGYLISHNRSSRGRFHTDWLNMMYTRIKVAFDLLSDDGCMVFAIDHNELANLIKIADEIFGENNRIGIVTVVHKPEGRNQEKFFATSNEYALFYAKNINNFSFNSVVLDQNIENTFDREDDKGKYRLNNYIRLGGGDDNLRINKPTFYYPIYVSRNLETISTEKLTDCYVVYPKTATQERTWKTKKETFEQALLLGEIIAEKDKKGEVVIYEKYRIDKGQLIKTHWIDKKYNAIFNGTKVLEKLMGLKAFDFPKSLYLIIDILKLTTDKNSIILDLFSGSATTAHAVMKLNSEDHGKRKYIMIQLPELIDDNREAYNAGYKNICDVGKERIRRAAEDIKKESGEFDSGFRNLFLDSSNMRDVFYEPDRFSQDLRASLVDNIKDDRNSLDVLFQVMLELGVSLTSKISQRLIENNDIFSVDHDRIIACFSNDISENVLKEIALLKPDYLILRDSSFASDSASINAVQIVKSISSSTEIKVI